MQLCIENVDQAGGCSYGYSCVYTDSISWASPNAAAADDPRSARRCSISCSASARRRRSARERRAEDRSILDWLTRRSARLKKELGAADRARLERLPRRRARDRAPHPEGRGAQQQRRAARAARRADRRARLVRRARQADVRPAGAGVRVGHHARVRVQARPRRVEPRLSGERRQRRRSTPRRTTASAKSASSTSRRSTRYHVSLMPYFLEQAEEHAGRRRQPARQHAGHLRIADGQLERAQPQALPLFLAGHAGGALKGDLHIKAADGTPMANAMLSRAARRSASTICSRSATAPARSI